MSSGGYESRKVVATYPNGLKVIYSFSNQDNMFKKTISNVDTSTLNVAKVIELLKAL